MVEGGDGPVLAGDRLSSDWGLAKKLMVAFAVSVGEHSPG